MPRTFNTTILVIIVTMTSIISWIKLAVFPFKYFSEPVISNENKMIMVAESDIQQSSDGIYIYDPIFNAWQNVVHTDVFTETAFCKTAMDKKNNLLYLLCEDQLFTCDFHQSTINTICNHNFHDAEITYFQSNLYCICGTNNPINSKLNISGSFDALYEFPEFPLGLVGHKIISNKNSVLVMGGYAESRAFQYTWNRNILEYNGVTWSTWDIQLPYGMSNYGAIRIGSGDKGNIIIVGGDNKNGFSNEIWVYDFNLKMFALADIKSPITGTTEAICMKDDHSVLALAFGYIRETFEETSFQNVSRPPDYLNRLIGRFISADDIHILGRDGCHYKIPLDSILNGFNICGYQNATCPYISKEVKIEIKWKMRHKKPQRYYYIGSWSSSIYLMNTTKIGKYLCCDICDQVSTSYDTQYHHLSSNHCTERTEEQIDHLMQSRKADDGEFFIWAQIDPVENKKTHKCLLCGQKFASSRGVMLHAKNKHAFMYNKLQ